MKQALALALAAATLCVALPALAQKKDAPASEAALLPITVTAPHHGDVLFNIFQDKPFTALSSLMVSQHFARLAPHDDDAEVLRGGLLLSYGLHDEAEGVFARLIERRAPPAVRDRAWFYLGKLQHQRGRLAEAERALARIEAPLLGGSAGPGSLEADHQLLRAQLRLANGDTAGAAAVLEPLVASAADKPSKDKPALPPAALMLARFNLAVALLRQGGDDATARGTALLDQVGLTPSADEEQRALRDRANVALGFAALQNKQPREARLALQRVRLEGAQSNKALLGHGWAAAELNDPQLALTPWTELASRDMADAAVLEAQIAVPYAFAEAGAYTQALDRYRQAVAAFEREGKAIDESIAAIRNGALVNLLVAANPDDEAAADGGLAAFARIDRLPGLPHGGHLRPLLADHPFQETYKHLRDLGFLQGHLTRWQDTLVVYTSMLDERKAAFAERLPRVRKSSGAIDLNSFAKRHAELTTEVAAGEAAGDGVAFADSSEEALLQRVQRGRTALAAAQADPTSAGVNEADLAQLAERLRRAEGALRWQLAQRASERGWEAKKGLRDSERALAGARERDTRLVQAQAEEPARHERFASRITALGERIRNLQPQVLALQTESGQQLAAIAVAELQAQQQRLVVYTAQARLAIAQILDRAQLAQRGGAPETPR